jgi:V-type H+-transporting ATPase subunit a
MVGVIDKVDEYRFKKIVFRVTKGNTWMNIVDIDA